MAELKLSEDGLFYWDGRQWNSTLAPDGRSRWNGQAWVPVAVMAAPVYPHYQQPATVRVPTPWTKPMQYAVVAWYLLSGIYALSLPFWMSGQMTDVINKALQRQASANPNVTPPPPEVAATMASMFSGVLWVSALIAVAIAAVVIVGALMRWTWMFYVVLVLLGLGALYLPVSVFGLVTGSTAMNPYSAPTWINWVTIASGIAGAALFVWMLVAVIRYGPWATTKTSPWPGAPAPAS